MEIRCTNCGADVPIGASTSGVICSYCETALFVGRQQGISHLVMSGYVSAEDAVLRLGRFLSQKEFSSAIEVEERKEFYFPFWQLSPKQGGKKIFWAGRTPLCDELASIPALGGETGKQTPMDIADHLLLQPHILLEEALVSANSAKENYRQENVFEDSKSAALIHVPFYKIRYSVHGETHVAFVDKVMGAVYADELPASPQRKKSRALAGVALGALLAVFLQVLLFPGVVQLFTLPLLLVLLYVLVSKLLLRMGW